MKIDLPKVGLSGHYKVGVIRASGQYEQLADFDNLITDAGLDFIATNGVSAATVYCRAGAGSAVPAVGQTNLVSQLGSASASGTSSATNSGGTPVWFTSLTRVYTFAIGAVVGNVAEIGTFSAETGGTMFSRALIKDAMGNPTTITILSDEQLVVTYEVRKYPPASDITGTVSISIDGVPTNFDYTIRAANVATNSGSILWHGTASVGNFTASVTAANAYETSTLGDVSGTPGFGEVNASSSVTYAYTNGSFYRDQTPTWGLSAANFATGIGAILFAAVSGGTRNGAFQISFSPKLPKTSAKTLTLTFRISWGRYAA